jgi:hypothetical protein
MILTKDLLAPLAGTGLPAPAFKSYVIKGGGKLRRIDAPNDAMRIVHWGLSDYLLEILLRSLDEKLKRMSTAYWPMSSMRAGVEQHARSRYFFVTDLRNAYESVRGDSIAGQLGRMDGRLYASVEDLRGTEQERLNGVGRFVRRYCLTKQGGLRFGGPASPILFNAYCSERLDASLLAVADEHNAVVTRCADDIVFSSQSPLSERVRKTILKAIRLSDFEPNDDKTRYRDLMHEAVTITGVRLKWRGMHTPAELSCSLELQQRLRSLLNIYHHGRVEDPVGLVKLIRGLWAAIVNLGGGHGQAWNRTVELYREMTKAPPTQTEDQSSYRLEPPETIAVTLWSGREVVVTNPHRQQKLPFRN